MAKLYHYPKCSTCRQALKFVSACGLKAELADITETPPSRAELCRMLKLKNGELRKLFNTSGERYRELKLKDKLAQLSVDEALALLAREGKLIKRPFLLTETAGLLGFDEGEWRAALCD